MRKVVAGLFISLDGIAESPDKWQFDNFDEERIVKFIDAWRNKGPEAVP